MKWFKNLFFGFLIIGLVFPQNMVSAKENMRDGEVEIIRDEYGVPHIYAQNTHDLYKAYGYTMAKDRLFQLEMFRRANEGTVSEILGEKFVPRDEQSRRDASTDKEIENMFARLDKDERELINKFVEGITLYVEEALKDPDNKITKEFHDFGILPKRWSTTDIIRVYMATLSFFMDSHQELTNAEILKKLTDEYGKEQATKMFDDLVWSDDPEAPITVENKNKENVSTSVKQNLSIAVADSAKQVREDRENFIALTEELGIPLKIGSNTVVVGPDKSESGNALLLSGPQVGFIAPGYLYEIGLHSPEIDIEGSGFIGFPFIMFGSTDKFSFSSTAGYGNIVDIFEEKLHPDDPEKYFHNNEWKKMDKRTEVIKVRQENGEIKEIKKEFYKTIHGPIVSMDTKNNVAYSKAWAFRDTEVDSMMAYMKMNWAQNIDDFKQAASEFTMSINWYYADTSGDIGYFHVGRIPKRNNTIDPRLPTPGTGEYDWTGFQSFESNPQMINPPSSYIANWNNKPAAGWSNGENNFVWGKDNRVQQFINGLEAKDKFTFEDINKINYTASFAQLRSHYFKPLLIKTLESHQEKNKDYSYLIEELNNWNNLEEDKNKDGYYDAGIATFFAEWWKSTHTNLFDKTLKNVWDLTKPITDQKMGATLAYKVLNKEVTNYNWMNKDVEQLMLDSVDEVLLKLQKEKGTEVDKWRSPIRTMKFGDTSLVGVPHGYGSDRPIIEMNRGSENHYLEMKPEGPVGFNVTPPGQIGFIKKDGTLDKHYADQISMYENWEFKKFLFKKDDVKKAAVSSEVLKLDHADKIVSFNDVSLEHPNYSAIEYLFNKNIITGYEDSTFRPEKQVTRSQIAIILTRALNLQLEQGVSFEDVAPAQSPYIEAVKKAGIMNGFSSKRFGPNDSVTRGQMALILTRAYKLEKANKEIFSDVNKNDPKYDAIQTLGSLHIFSGYADGTFRSSNSINRGQISEILVKTIELQKDKK
ncbi:hypothetical protein DV702_06135 [Sporosarcina sp. PTS2304]|uniref:penicillin acylase family protein n=1 Tax=Sporosarcina sp. PTS2304 TaxID=2283194 RepID=UPI000E0D9BD8|nr:penicillin acylase family protein [Sporosarcina sp. PTS2304]AXH99359.1 hypothetical protein DV702_06135 [Sporosarcina sp. PTS2304]